MVGRRRWTEDAIVKAFRRNRDFPLMMCVVMCEHGGWVDLSCVAGCGESVFMKGDLKWYGRHPGLSEIVVATTVTGNNPCTYVVVANPHHTCDQRCPLSKGPAPQRGLFSLHKALHFFFNLFHLHA